jgi:hypothetical protein
MLRRDEVRSDKLRLPAVLTPAVKEPTMPRLVRDSALLEAQP